MYVKDIVAVLVDKVNKIIMSIYGLEHYIGTVGTTDTSTVTYRLNALEQNTGGGTNTNNVIDINSYLMILNNTAVSNRIKIPTYKPGEIADVNDIQHDVTIKYYTMNKPYLKHINNYLVVGINYGKHLTGSDRDDVVLARYEQYYTDKLLNKNNIVITGINDDVNLSEPSMNNVIINKYLKYSKITLTNNNLVIPGVNEITTHTPILYEQSNLQRYFESYTYKIADTNKILLLGLNHRYNDITSYREANGVLRLFNKANKNNILIKGLNNYIMIRLLNHDDTYDYQRFTYKDDINTLLYQNKNIKGWDIQ